MTKDHLPIILCPRSEFHTQSVTVSSIQVLLSMEQTTELLSTKPGARTNYLVPRVRFRYWLSCPSAPGWWRPYSVRRIGPYARRYRCFEATHKQHVFFLQTFLKIDCWIEAPSHFVRLVLGFIEANHFLPRRCSVQRVYHLRSLKRL